MSRSTLALILLLGLGSCQSPGSIPEVHPKLTTYKCTKGGGCREQTTALVLESTSHPIHQRDNPSLNCTSSGSGDHATLNLTVCPDEATCQKNCIIEGISDYPANGVITDGSALRLNMLSPNGSVELSPRVYLLNQAEDAYEMINLTGQEMSFDVDMAKLPCGMNAALYLLEMEPTGGKNLSDLNVAGAAYGTGECDAQCYTNTWISGLGNINGTGACCAELDIWEANARSTQLAPHTCSHPGLYRCSGDECGQTGVCDKSGCKINHYNMGNHDYYGEGMVVDTNRPFKVVTQFPADASGNLTSVQRFYIQDNKTIPIPNDQRAGVPKQNFIDDAFCSASNATAYMTNGGLPSMGAAMSRGMVLTFSIWWDKTGFMSWLDQDTNGPCNATEGSPEGITKVEPQPTVTYSNIRWGDIGSTF